MTPMSGMARSSMVWLVCARRSRSRRRDHPHDRGDRHGSGSRRGRAGPARSRAWRAMATMRTGPLVDVSPAGAGRRRHICRRSPLLLQVLQLGRRARLYSVRCSDPDSRPRRPRRRAPWEPSASACTTGASAGRRSGASSSTSCRETEGHVTGAELVERCRRRDPATTPSTVYRTLDVLEELGIVRHGHGPDGREEYHVLPEASTATCTARAAAGAGRSGRRLRWSRLERPRLRG